MAVIALIGIAWRIFVRFSNVALPSRKNTLSGIPRAMFHRRIIMKSTMVASDPITIEKTSAGRYRHYKNHNSDEETF